MDNELKRMAEALDKVSLHLEELVARIVTAGAVPVAEPTVEEEEVEEITVGPVAEVIDLSTAPVAEPEPKVNGAEVLPAVSTWTKQSLWELMNETYQLLETRKRGNEIGVVLSEFNALHVDQLDPAHYPAVAERLQALQQEVQQ